MAIEVKAPFTWHKKAYAKFVAESAAQGIRAGMEMLDNILAHAEEEFGTYAHITVTDALLADGSTWSGDCIVLALRIPTDLEFDVGAVLMLLVRMRTESLISSDTLYVTEHTLIDFQK